MSEPMHVCFCCDENYAPHLGAALASIASSKAPGDRLSFHVVDVGLSERARRRLAAAASIRGGDEIEFIKADDALFSGFPLYGDNCSVTQNLGPRTYAYYYRLLLPRLVPQAGRLIYLDCDVCVRESLSGLFGAELGGRLVAAVEDIGQENATRLGVERYFNSGVMLIDAAGWRREGVEAGLFAWEAANRERILYLDQDILNGVLAGRALFLDKRWNAQTSRQTFAVERGWNAIGRTASIVHFIGRRKPWTRRGGSPFFWLYARHLAQTAWRWRLPVLVWWHLWFRARAKIALARGLQLRD
ncbi:MAG: glycosyltransferase family 8 protein [Duodenibacillus sp.]|nr:glycosyltransferase family 8 protein [Duodenibacillus sp.]